MITLATMGKMVLGEAGSVYNGVSGEGWRQ